MEHRKISRKLSAVVIVCSLLATAFTSAIVGAAEAYLYRYINEEGVKVMNHTIPPEFVQNGYEVLSQSGQLIKVVEPAPSEGEISQRVKDSMLKKKFDALKRRYSSVEDIESAKARRLKNLDTSISILRGNISSINFRLEDLMKQAADMERQGRKVSSQIFQQMQDAKLELSIAESSLDSRLQEYDDVAMKFDSDLSTFLAGSKLVATEDENGLN